VVLSGLNITERVSTGKSASNPHSGSARAEAHPLHERAGASLEVSSGARSANEDGGSAEGNSAESDTDSSPATLSLEESLLGKQVLVSLSGNDLISGVSSRAA